MHILKIVRYARKCIKADPSLVSDKPRLRSMLENEYGAMTSSSTLDTVLVIVVGLYAVAYVLPSGLSALGGANTTGWPTGTENFIIPIGIFVMIGILVMFAKSGGAK